MWLSVKRPTSAQVMISQKVSSSPTSGSLLSAQSSLQILCRSFIAPPPLTLSLFLSKINKKKLKKNNGYQMGCHKKTLRKCENKKGHEMSKQVISWNKEHLKIIREKRSNMIWHFNRTSLEKTISKKPYDKSKRKLSILFLIEVIYLMIYYF